MPIAKNGDSNTDTTRMTHKPDGKRWGWPMWIGTVIALFAAYTGGVFRDSPVGRLGQLGDVAYVLHRQLFPAMVGASLFRSSTPD
jgi:hypothetical protein